MALIVSFFGSTGLAKVAMIGFVGTFVGTVAAPTIALITTISSFALPVGLGVFAGLGLLRWAWFLAEDIVRLYKFYYPTEEQTEEEEDKLSEEEKDKLFQEKKNKLLHELLRHSFLALSYAGLLVASLLLLSGVIATAAGAAAIIASIVSFIAIGGFVAASWFMSAATTWRIVGESLTDSKQFSWSRSISVGVACLTLTGLVSCVSVVGAVCAFVFPQFAIPILIATVVVTGIMTLLIPTTVKLFAKVPTTTTPTPQLSNNVSINNSEEIETPYKNIISPKLGNTLEGNNSQKISSSSQSEQNNIEKDNSKTKTSLTSIHTNSSSNSSDNISENVSDVKQPLPNEKFKEVIADTTKENITITVNSNTSEMYVKC